MTKNISLLKPILLLVAIWVSSVLLYKATVSAYRVKSNPPIRLARLSDSPSVHSNTRGIPSINFSDGHDLLSEYEGPDRARAVLRDNLASPAALSAADFDEDGVPDLICAYRVPGGGIITLHRGNSASIYPNTAQTQQRKAEGEFTDAPFLSAAKVFELPLAPDFVVLGDFDANGHQDMVIASQGSNALFLLEGDGQADFGATKRIELPGAVTALATGEVNRADGLEDIIVGILAADGPKVLVYESPEGASRANPREFNVPSEVTALALGKLDDDYLMDFAVAAGRDVLVYYGQDNKAPHARAGKRRFATSVVRSITIGNFMNRDKPSLAVLTDDSALHLLGQSDAMKTKEKKSAQIDQWEDQSLALSAHTTKLVRARVSCAQTDSLIAIDSDTNQIQIIAEDPYAQKQNTVGSATVSRKVAAFDVEGSPVAASPIRLNGSALDNLVVLRSGQTNPSVMIPQVMMTFVVQTPSDMTGVNSFRDAILAANANPGLDEIVFAVTPAGPFTINLTAPLPLITDPVVISGPSQPGFSGNPIVEINGTAVTSDGLVITSGNTTVSGLVINRFGGSGINLDSSNNQIIGSFIGTDLTGTAAAGNGQAGVFANGSNNVIGTPSAGNVLSANGSSGVNSAGVLLISADGSVVQGNRIGTDITGTIDLGNSFSGVIIQFGSGNIIGGEIATTRNVISGNDTQGVLIAPDAPGNLVQGNRIGTNATGTAALSNTFQGVLIISANNTIGGTAASAANVLSGNGAEGIRIANSTGNLVQGNFIGTDPTGTAAIPNTFAGVFIDGANGNTIGGTVAGARNVLSGGADRGVTIVGNGNFTQGNLIGTDASGAADLGNTLGGVLVVGSSNVIGGTEAGARNIISGNEDGVQIAGAGSSNNVIQGNFIGTDVSGTAHLGNTRLGVLISLAATNNTVGGTVAGSRNVISGNEDGVQIASSGSSGNVIQGNFIGTDVSGTADLGNLRSGVLISLAAANNTVGGISAGARNVISGNDGSGIQIANAGTTNNAVQGNFIGTDASGTFTLGNGDGVHFNLGASGNSIGGSASSAGNVIAFNALNGVAAEEGAGNSILSNSIFSNSLLGIDLGADGVTPNDAGDADAGANNLQNFPQLTSADVVLGSTVIQGNFSSTPNTTYTLQFFSNTACDDSGFGEGQQLIGTRTVSTDPSGNAGISFSFPGNFSLPITSTATDPAGNTSEFSPCALNAAGIDLAIIKTASPGVVKPGDTLTYTITAINNGSTLALNVTVLDNLPNSITFVSCSATGNGLCFGSGNDRRVVFTALSPGASETIRFVTSVKTPLPNGTLISNTATISSSGSESNFSDNTSTTIVIVSDAPPTMICPGNIVRNAVAGQCLVIVEYPLPTLNEVLTGATIVCSPPSGSLFPAGTTMVNCEARSPRGETGNCSFTITVNSPSSARLTLEPGSAVLNFGLAEVRRKPKKPPKGCDCDATFTIENLGCAALNLTLDSIMRTGNDVTSGRISNPDDSKTFSVKLINNNQSETDLAIGAVVSIPTGQTSSFRVLFKPGIPALTGKTTGLAAVELMPDLLTSKITFSQNGIETFVVNLAGRISTDVQIINPDDARAAKRARFTKSGNEFTVIFGVFDADLDVNRVTFEFLDGSGQLVEQVFDVDLAQPISQRNIIKGQSFVVTQRFTGAASHPEIASVRVSVFDPHSSDSVTAQLGATPGALQSLQNPARRVVVLPIRRFDSLP